MVAWILRNTLPFLVAALLVRMLLRRQFGKHGVIELLLINAVGDLMAHSAFEEQHPLWSGIGSIAWWLVMVAVALILLHRAPGAAPWLGYFTGPVDVVRNGVPIPEAMRRHRLSQEQLESELRKQGIDDLAGVRRATLESDGSLAVLQSDSTARELQRIADALEAIRADLQRKGS